MHVGNLCEKNLTLVFGQFTRFPLCVSETKTRGLALLSCSAVMSNLIIYDVNISIVSLRRLFSYHFINFITLNEKFFSIFLSSLFYCIFFYVVFFRIFQGVWVSLGDPKPNDNFFFGRFRNLLLKSIRAAVIVVKIMSFYHTKNLLYYFTILFYNISFIKYSIFLSLHLNMIFYSYFIISFQW